MADITTPPLPAAICFSKNDKRTLGGGVSSAPSIRRISRRIHRSLHCRGRSPRTYLASPRSRVTPNRFLRAAEGRHTTPFFCLEECPFLRPQHRNQTREDLVGQRLHGGFPGFPYCCVGPRKTDFHCAWSRRRNKFTIGWLHRFLAASSQRTGEADITSFATGQSFATEQRTNCATLCRAETQTDSSEYRTGTFPYRSRSRAASPLSDGRQALGGCSYGAATAGQPSRPGPR